MGFRSPSNLLIFRLLLLVIPLSLTACALGGAWRCPTETVTADASLFYAPPVPFSATLTTIKEEQFLLTFASAYPSGFPANDQVPGYYYRPPDWNKKLPFILLLHGYGGSRKLSGKEANLAKALAREGYAVLLLTLPYHFERSPDGDPPAKYMMVTEPDKTIDFYRQAVLDVRRALDWAQSRVEIDRTRMAVVGVSLGAMVGNLALGVEERLRAGVSVVGGADPAKFVWESLMMIGLRSQYQRQGYTLEQLERHWAVINSANYLRGKSKPLLMINGRWDYTMPYACTESLACAAPGAKMVWLWTGHWGPALFPGRTQREIAEFLQEVMPEKKH